MTPLAPGAPLLTDADARAIDAATRDALPWPIAAHFRRARASHSRAARFGESLKLVEGVLRLLALVNLADASPSVAPRDRKRWLDALVNPGMGKLFALFEETTRHLASHGGAFLAESVALTDGAWEAAVSAIIAMRNRWAHGEGHVGDAEAAPLLDALEAPLREVLAGVQFLRHFQLGVVDEVRDDGAAFTWYWYPARGADERGECVVLSGRGRVVTGVVALIDTRTGHALHLAPFLTRALGPMDRLQHLFWLDRFERVDGSLVAHYRHPTSREQFAGGLVDVVDPNAATVPVREWIEGGTTYPHRVDLELDATSSARLAGGVGEESGASSRPAVARRRTWASRAPAALGVAVASAVSIGVSAVRLIRDERTPGAADAEPRAMCLARTDPSTAFHLRAQPACASRGDEFERGSAEVLEVLAPVGLERNGSRLFRVRVARDRRVGYVFLDRNEVVGPCPEAWWSFADAAHCREATRRSREGVAMECSGAMALVGGVTDAASPPGRDAPFCIDRAPVSVAQYEACVRAGGCTAAVTTPTRGGGTGAGCNSGRAERRERPMNCVTWSQAEAFCTWANGRLPTGAQWDRAAATGVPGLPGAVAEWVDEVAASGDAAVVRAAVAGAVDRHATRGGGDGVATVVADRVRDAGLGFRCVRR